MDEVDVNSEDSPRYHSFSKFAESTDLQPIVDTFRYLCRDVGVDPDSCEGIYTALKRELTNWKCLDIWNLLDKRAGLPEYARQTACKGLSVLVVGAGPVGLRTAIECALLGARVDVVEKRTSFSRNNVLHLWSFVIADLVNLGAKKFYGKFCTGSINHMSVKFTGLTEPTDQVHGWSARCTPTPSALSGHYDTIIAADGKQKSLPGFQFKEFRAKLALAITVNFVNGNTQQENSVDEISGVSYVYNQEFFKNLGEKHGIELENIVYYKDETHYFVMTAKKSSLLKKGVIKQDQSNPHQLLSPANIDHTALEEYAVEAATFATHGGLGELKFALNHLGEHDVALFDFTSLFAAENASRIIEKEGKRVLLLIAGDSLLEPFWPTGSGCARGFLGAFDAAWTLKGFASGKSPLELLEEREAIYYLLPQTTPERLHKDITGYTIDPKSRYPNLNEAVPPRDLSCLYEANSTVISDKASTAQPSGLGSIPYCQPSISSEETSAATSANLHNTLPQSHVTLPQSHVTLPQSHVTLPQSHVTLPQGSASAPSDAKLPNINIVAMETPTSNVRERIRLYQGQSEGNGSVIIPHQSNSSNQVTPAKRSEQKVELAPARRSEQKVELAPAKRSEQKVELAPARMSEQKVELAPARRSEQKVELAPAKRSEQKVELAPAKRSEQKVELAPAKRSEQKVELAPARRSEQKVELAPARRSEQKVELAPARRSEQKVELAPAKRSEQKVELAPAKRSEQKVELAPARRSEQKVELAPAKRSEQKVELAPAKKSEQKVELAPAKRSEQKVERSPGKKPQQKGSFFRGLFHKRSHPERDDVIQEEAAPKRPRTDMEDTRTEAKAVGSGGKLPDRDTAGEVSTADTKQRLKRGGIAENTSHTETVSKRQKKS